MWYLSNTYKENWWLVIYENMSVLVLYFLEIIKHYMYCKLYIPSMNINTHYCTYRILKLITADTADVSSIILGGEFERKIYRVK